MARTEPFTPQFAPLGDRAVMVTLGDAIDDATRLAVRALSVQLDRQPIPGVVDQVPAFTSVAVHYEPARVAIGPDESPYAAMVAALTSLVDTLRPEAMTAAHLVEIPVCYGGDLGPDLEELAQQHGMAVDDVVRLHTSAEYQVYMVGFMPGFAYLGGLPEQLVTPRRATPRPAVAAGSVGIGGQQTGVYPLVSPGGWNLIGRTPLALFDLARDEPALLHTGDRVRFRAINRAAYATMSVSG